MMGRRQFPAGFAGEEHKAGAQHFATESADMFDECIHARDFAGKLLVKEKIDSR
jgi:hypothetical protein